MQARFVRTGHDGRDGTDPAPPRAAASSGGAADDALVAAALSALRARGDAAAVVGAALLALGESARLVPIRAGRPAIAISGCDEARDGATTLPLLACLLADAGVQVIVQGGDRRCPSRPGAGEVMSALGLPPAGSPLQAADALARGDPVIVPVAVVSPTLAAMLDSKGVSRARELARVVATLLDPTSGGGCLRAVRTLPAGLGRLQIEVLRRDRRPAVLVGAPASGAFADRLDAARLDWLRAGPSEPLVRAIESGPGGSALHDASDASSIARWIQSVRAGERPVPDAVQHRLAALQHAASARVRRGVPA